MYLDGSDEALRAGRRLFYIFFSHLRFCETYDTEVDEDGELK
jgi:hypothetical protein